MSSAMSSALLSAIRASVREMVDEDLRGARAGTPPVIFRVWPDYTLHPQIDRSAPRVKADAAGRSYDARGRNIVRAVIDSGIDASHPHFFALELAKEASGVPLPEGLTTGLHRDFSYFVSPDDPRQRPPRTAEQGPAAPRPGGLRAEDVKIGVSGQPSRGREVLPEGRDTRHIRQRPMNRYSDTARRCAAACVPNE